MPLRFSQVYLLACHAAWLAILVPVSSPAAPRPNVILVMTDDQGYGDLGCHGNAMIRTPHLDQLHAESVRLTNFHVDPTCSPTRAALLTGRYSTRGGVWHTIMGRSILYRQETTLADLFALAGYATAILGKWHLGDNYPFRPQDRGFQQSVVLGGGGVGQTPDHWGNSYFNDTYLKNGTPTPYQGYCTDVFFQEAIHFVESHRDTPFFLYLPTNVPHGPYEVPESYRIHYEGQGVPSAMARFYGMIEQFDENLGRLRAKLRELGLEENTIFLFLTDNGTAAGAGPVPASPTASWAGFNAGMKGQKGSPYEGGHRVPCFVRWPARHWQGGRDVSQLTAHLDLLPTLVEACGLSHPAPLGLDGRSLVPLLDRKPQPWPERTLFVHSQRIEIPEPWRQCAVMTESWRLVNGHELYDIRQDPGQERNLAGTRPEVVQQLRAAYETWWQSLQPAFTGYPWIILGAPQANPAVLTCHDWHAEENQVPWSQARVRRMPAANGYWMVEVALPGDYAFTLRHQPTTARLPLRGTRAQLRVGEVEAASNIPDQVHAVTLTLTLPAGPTKVQTWIEDPGSDESRGAFFVEVLKLN